ncbi:hypothetical protein CYG48_17095 (plasmid) [Neorhizobium sp. SOG26]|nr:hypothetical protein CYG48_17095 [Neorhizobium sp. SOG26]
MESVVASRDEKTTAPPAAAEEKRSPKSPPGFVATRLVTLLQESEQPLCYIARSESAAARIAEAIAALFPELEQLVLPPWDCLPYDRVPPSRHCMGVRMDALRIWKTSSDTPRLLLTSVEAALQRVPPMGVITDSRMELAVGEPFDREAFSSFTQRTGYVEEGVADDPGELVVREGGVIDIYPGGAPGPMRIVLSEDDKVKELRGFDRVSQRTESYLERVTIGPASEAIPSDGVMDELASKQETMERVLLRLYQDMPSVFNLLGDAKVLLAPDADERVGRYLEIIGDAYQSRQSFGETETSASRSIYLDREEWGRCVGKSANVLALAAGELSVAPADGDPRRALAKFARESMAEGRTVVVAGRSNGSSTLFRRLAKAAGTEARTVDRWEQVLEAKPGSLLKLSCDLNEGFIDPERNIVVLTAAGGIRTKGSQNRLLTEPELQIGDVVVHEDHGVGVLKDLESITVEDAARDAARLEYRDNGSVLVPMEDFGKLWRYGSEPEAVTLDRLHTDAWAKKREKMAADIQSTARHLLKLAKQRLDAQAQTFVPPRAAFSAFIRRFPFTETQDQAEAVEAVLSDLASGRPMNRLVCGDVGFGKTEIALRAAAAVALSGGQVVLIAPTTVLARQHFTTFRRRFAETGVEVGMLSHLLKSSEAKEVKTALAEGRMGVVVGTQALLAKDVQFANLSLLIVDEEHRFGVKEKRAMTKLAPTLHTLIMSATPIPQTLQSAMMGIQEVSLLTTAPARRRPIRTSLADFDQASMRTGLMREYRRGGQSFVVVPRIEDIEEVEAILRKIVPELSVKVAHGKMRAAEIDEVIVGFAEGDGDILLATSIIENGLDVPRANTMFVWHADRFGLAQLHQLRGRVGRGAAQGVATLLTEAGAELAEETRLRLSTLVEHDRLGAGLAISLRDLDLRGGGDIAGEDQAGHMKVIGTGLYQQLLAAAVAKLRKQPVVSQERPILNLGNVGTIPTDYVSDPAVRLNLYGRLLRASKLREINDLEEEFEDRFGEPPQDVLLLLRTTRLQVVAARLGITKLEAGPKALAMTLTLKTPSRAITALTKKGKGVRREDRLIFEQAYQDSDEQIRFFEKIMSGVSGAAKGSADRTI